MPDEEAIISEVRYLTGWYERICGGYKREGGCALPGETSRHAICASVVARRRDVP